mmetsp:Transcript_56457/g.183433  ORF Transcript_56457/g.183433 Transcript_56457/m.183433 type:complete len:87 (-) Transcript_56457:152-412(-)
MGSAEDVTAYTQSKGLKGAAMHGCAQLSQDVSSQYGLMYIPHKVLLDKEGTIVKNFKLGNLQQELDALLAAGGLFQQSGEESKKDD